MDSNVELNPYSSTSQCGEHGPPTASLLFSVLLVIAAMNLLWHGALMVIGYFEQFANLPSSVSIFASNFFLAIILKDCIAGGTALLAAILIFCRHRIGWWMAVIHWHWYLTWNAIIVFAAESFAWRLPARYERAEIVRQMVICLIYSIVAIAFFNLKPILRILNVSIERRLHAMALILAGTASLGFLINWWSSIR